MANGIHEVGIRVSARDGTAPGFQQVVGNARRLGVELRQADAGGDFRTTGRSLDKLQGQLASTRALVTGLGASLAASLGLGQLARLVDEYAGLSARLQLVSRDAAEARASQQALFDLAQRAGQSIGDLGSLFISTSGAIKGLGGGAREALGIVEAVSAALKISGASSQDAASAILQFGQALRSPTVQWEELGPILEAAPRLAEAIAQGMGRAVGELKALAAAGKITGADLGNALLGVLPQLRAQVAEIPDSIAGGFTRIANAVQRYVGEADRASGASRVVAGSLSTVAEHFAAVADTAVAVGTVLAAVWGGRVVSSLSAAAAQALALRAATLSEAQAAAQAAAAELAAAEAALARARAMGSAMLGSAALAAAEERATAATVAHTAAQQRLAAVLSGTGVAGALRGLLGLLGGPVGLIVTLGLVATAWFGMSRAASQAVGIANANVEQLRGKLAALKQEMQFGAGEQGETKAKIAVVRQQIIEARAAAAAPPSEITVDGITINDRSASATAERRVRELQEQLSVLEEIDKTFGEIAKKQAEPKKDGPLHGQALSPEQLAELRGSLDQKVKIEQAHTDKLAELERARAQLGESEFQRLKGLADAERGEALKRVADAEGAETKKTESLKRELDARYAAESKHKERLQQIDADLAAGRLTDDAARTLRAQSAARLQEDLAAVAKRGASASGAAARAVNQHAEALRRLALDAAAAKRRLEELTGAPRTQAQIAQDVRLENLDLINQARTLAGLTPEQAPQVSPQETARIVDQLVQAEAATRALAQLDEQRQTILERVRLTEERAANLRTAGVISEWDAQRQVMEANRVAATELEALLPRMAELSGGLGDRARLSVQEAAQAAEQMRLLARDPLWSELQQSAGNAFSTFLSSIPDVLAGTKTIGEAFRGLLADIARSVQRLLSDRLAQSLVSALLGGVGNLFGGAVNPNSPGIAGTHLAAKYAAGGYVRGPGTGTSDSILARVSNGEYVLRAQAVQMLGTDFLDALNGLRTPPLPRTRYADGGLVNLPAPGSAGSSVQLDQFLFFEQESLARAMKSRAGVRAILSVIGDNASSVRTVLSPR